jgi:hypothetical protein
VRAVAIIQHDGERPMRPMVRIATGIAGRLISTEISLINRSEFAYPLLPGRNSLAPFALIDAASTHLSDAACDPRHQSRSARS